jgi:Fe-S-cluster containining protein
MSPNFSLFDDNLSKLTQHQFFLFFNFNHNNSYPSPMEQLKIPDKLLLLRKIYSIYEQYTNSLDLACKKGCAHCCTRNVVITSLEGILIYNHFKANADDHSINKIRKFSHLPRFHTQLTTNDFAEMCMKGEETPDEQGNQVTGRCPLLKNETCTIYDVRPFECRSLISNVNCRDEGCAEQDPFSISVNTVFKQFIEHVDSSGISGNLTDILVHLDIEMGKGDDLKGGPVADNLIQNKALQILLVQPEHQEKMQPIIDSIQQIRI